MWRRVVWYVAANVSEECAASFFWMEEYCVVYGATKGLDLDINIALCEPT